MNHALLCLPDTFRQHSYFSAQATLFGAPPRVSFAIRSKHLKRAHTSSPAPALSHARNTMNPSFSAFCQVKLGTRGVRAALTLLYPK